MVERCPNLGPRRPRPAYAEPDIPGAQTSRLDGKDPETAFPDAAPIAGFHDRGPDQAIPSGRGVPFPWPEGAGCVRAYGLDGSLASDARRPGKGDAGIVPAAVPCGLLELRFSPEQRRAPRFLVKTSIGKWAMIPGSDN